MATPGGVGLSTTLHGGLATTYLNWSTVSSGTNYLPMWGSTVEIDFEPASAFWIADNSPPDTYRSINIGPFVVPGGRHSLTVFADRDFEVPESNEDDNWWSGQWVWEPQEIPFENPAARPAPPPRGSELYPNQDGHRFLRDPLFSWVISVAPFNEGDDYDLLVHDDYFNSTAGFSSDLGVSGQFSNLTDFVVGHYLGTPTTLYPGVMRWDVYGGGGGYALDATDARHRDWRFDQQPHHTALGANLPAFRLADVYEAYLEAGTRYSFILVPESWAMSFAVYEPISGGVYSRADGTHAVPHSSMHILTYEPDVTGFHPIVVFRDNGTNADWHIDYDFYGYTGMVDVPIPEKPAHRLAFHGAWPNPMTAQGQIAFELAKPGPVRLRVFDLRGRYVGAILDEELTAGPHSVSWDGCGRDGKRLGAGIYWLRFEAGGQKFVKRVVLLR
jgi:hypothetical protein